jgi:hypothetical protein
LIFIEFIQITSFFLHPLGNGWGHTCGRSGN